MLLLENLTIRCNFHHSFTIRFAKEQVEQSVFWWIKNDENISLLGQNGIFFFFFSTSFHGIYAAHQARIVAFSTLVWALKMRVCRLHNSYCTRANASAPTISANKRTHNRILDKADLLQFTCENQQMEKKTNTKKVVIWILCVFIIIVTVLVFTSKWGTKCEIASFILKMKWELHTHTNIHSTHIEQ